MKPSFRIGLLLLLLGALLSATALTTCLAAADRQAAAPQRTLRPGDRGEAVGELQALLAARGFDPGPRDGIFGPLTGEAVRAAQSALGLESDGLAGPLTMAALRRNPAPATAPPEAGGLVIYRAEQEPAVPALAAGSRQARLPGPPTAGPEAAPGLAAGAPAPAAPDQPAPAAPVDLALTINGLPDPESLSRILERLAQLEMAVTFFVTGEEAEAHPELLRRIHRAGHEVGNLGYTALDMRRITPLTARALISRTQRAIASATGSAPAFFRPPLGRFDRQLSQLAEGEGLSLVLWSNVAVRPVPEMTAGRLVEALSGSLFPRAVLMLPMDRPVAVAALEPLLERMAAAGYRSRTLSTLTGRP
ncbi:MAG: polysaccharide deacetylase family protein [Bacillota bacterium]